ncbi:MAG TPA: lactate racemase domain-containing protein [Eubacteriales bacterium]|nr:lactate racemase domain-containing protein [Eubacteriales bacterium]
MDICLSDTTGKGIPNVVLKAALTAELEKRPAKRVLLIPPDYTRYHSNAGFLSCVCYNYYHEAGAQVDVLPALGTHVPVTKEQAADMFPDIPYSAFLEHNWRSDVVRLGEVPADFIAEITEGLWNEPIDVEVNHRLIDGNYDLILSIGQVVPHEVIGMANHSKNIFVGVGGADMINKSHMVGAVYGMERMMGRDNTPVRRIFDYALKRYLKDIPLVFLLTVTTAPGGVINTHGMFMGAERDALEAAIALAQKKNVDFLEHGVKKCVVYLDPKEFKSTWLGNKAVYRTRMAIATGGDLIVLAPGVERFGEDSAVDALIRKYGYCGRLKVLELFNKPENADLRDNMGAAAHLIHGSSDGRFRISYAVKSISKEEIASVHFNPLDYDETVKRYDPEKLRSGYNTLEDGEEIFFIPNPALGLWIDKTRFNEEA